MLHFFLTTQILYYFLIFEKYLCFIFFSTKILFICAYQPQVPELSRVLSFGLILNLPLVPQMLFKHSLLLIFLQLLTTFNNLQIRELYIVKTFISQELQATTIINLKRKRRIITIKKTLFLSLDFTWPGLACCDDKTSTAALGFSTESLSAKPSRLACKLIIPKQKNHRPAKGAPSIEKSGPENQTQTCMNDFNKSTKITWKSKAVVFSIFFRVCATIVSSARIITFSLFSCKH